MFKFIGCQGDENESNNELSLSTQNTGNDFKKH